MSFDSVLAAYDLMSLTELHNMKILNSLFIERVRTGRVRRGAAGRHMVVISILDLASVRQNPSNDRLAHPLPVPSDAARGRTRFHLPFRSLTFIAYCFSTLDVLRQPDRLHNHPEIVSFCLHT